MFFIFCSMAYPLDFRRQVFKVKQKEKLTFQELSDRFDIPIRTLFRWQNRIAPKATRNKPARGKVNAIGAITDFKLFNTGLFDSNINSGIFFPWPTQGLLPDVPSNAVIVLDNAQHFTNERMPKLPLKNKGVL